jgi:hypothetical protein
MPVSFSLETPDESFRLGAAERANIGGDYDPDALERLLQLVHPDHRMDVLANFQIQPFDGRKRPYFIEILDPKVQPLLDPVYAPVWQNATDEEIEANIYGLPGRETVKQQRREMRDRRRADPE